MGWPGCHARLPSYPQWSARHVLLHDPLGAFPDAFVLGPETSGSNTQSLLAGLLQQEAQVCLFNPLQICRFRRAQCLRPTKTYAISARTMLAYVA